MHKPATITETGWAVSSDIDIDDQILDQQQENLEVSNQIVDTNINKGGWDNQDEDIDIGSNSEPEVEDIDLEVLGTAFPINQEEESTKIPNHQEEVDKS